MSGIPDLIEVIQKLSQARDLPTVQDIVRHAARRLTDADGATFVLCEGEKCHFVDEEAVGPLWKGQRFAMSPPLCAIHFVARQQCRLVC